jgi:hypothetical protein
MSGKKKIEYTVESVISQEFLPLGFKVLSELVKPGGQGVCRGWHTLRGPYTPEVYSEMVAHFKRFGWEVVHESKGEQIVALIRRESLFHIMIGPEGDGLAAELEVYDTCAGFAAMLAVTHGIEPVFCEPPSTIVHIQDTLETLGELAARYPTERFGQLLLNALRSHARPFPFNDTDAYERNIKLFSRLFTMGDREMLDAIQGRLEAHPDGGAS